MSLSTELQSLKLKHKDIIYDKYVCLLKKLIEDNPCTNIYKLKFDYYYYYKKTVLGER